MSRHNSTVSVAAAKTVFGKEALKGVHRSVDQVKSRDNSLSLDEMRTITVAHGYDRPLATYFCDINPDCEKGIYYGSFGFTTQMKRGEYLEAMQKLGLAQAADAVALDIPY